MFCCSSQFIRRSTEVLLVFANQHQLFHSCFTISSTFISCLGTCWLVLSSGIYASPQCHSHTLILCWYAQQLLLPAAVCITCFRLHYGGNNPVVPWGSAAAHCTWMADCQAIILFWGITSPSRIWEPTSKSRAFSANILRSECTTLHTSWFEEA